MKAIVLSGGGARGAYQVGVLTAVADITSRLKLKHPFQIYTGISAGAINAAYLASGTDDFSLTCHRLSKMWGELHAEQVFRTDALSLGKIGLSWMGELSFGGLTGGNQSRSLLDTSPLSDLIRNNLEFSRIDQHIQSGLLHAVAVTALDYKTSNAITFVQGHPGIQHWVRSRRRSESAKLQTEHIVSSSAIPLLFTPGKINGHYYGDGCVRNSTPISPALHLGASDLLVIGVRKQDTTAYDLHVQKLNGPPSVARVVNVLLNSVLLDGIETDIERLNRINEFMSRLPEEHHEKLNFKKVNHVWVSPSEDIGAIAATMSSKLPRVIRYLLKGLGPLDDASEIISYLLFEPSFCSRLIEIGYKDGMKQAEEIEKFLEK